MRKHRCDRCVWYVRTLDMHGQDLERGQCHRYPPLSGAIRWPSVGADDWCGEWFAETIDETPTPRKAR